MRNDLVTEQIEIDPVIGAASLFAFKYAAVKRAGGIEIVDRERQVKKIVHIRTGRASNGLG